MSFHIEVQSGSSVRLPTKGKYCDRDIVVAAVGGGGSGENKLALILGKQSATENPYEITESDLGTAIAIPIHFFYGKTGLTRFSSENITEVAGEAFYDCSNMFEVNIPNVQTLGNSAFRNCKKLETLNIASATEIGNYCFYGCTALKELNAPNVKKIGSYGIYLCKGLETVNIPNATHLASYAFNFCEFLTAVNMEQIVEIQGQAFGSCFRLTYVEIPATCTTIGAQAFDQVGRAATGAKCTYRLFGTTPPAIQSTTFTSRYVNKIIVPSGYGEIYKTATNWAAFADYIEEAEA